MKTRITIFLEKLRESYWFLPLLMALLAFGLAWGMVRLDHLLERRVEFFKVFWTYGGGSQGARSLLSLVASSMITVAGVIFSITIVTLTLASQQFGPRLLINFMKDQGNQIVLGTFIATFLYCIFVLPTVIDNDEVQFIPYFSISMAVVLTLFSLGAFIYFIHHVPTSIQVSQVIEVVRKDLLHTINKYRPEKIGPQKKENELALDEPRLPENFELGNMPVKSIRSGYIQALDVGGLVSLAEDMNAILRINYRPGDFVVRGVALASIFPPRTIDEEVVSRVNDAFLVGFRRTSTQDIEYAFKELVEVAMRALSPGVNDPNTAINCLDRLCEGLCELVQRKTPSAFHLDKDKKLRVIHPPMEFAEFLDSALNEIRFYAGENMVIYRRLLESLITLSEMSPSKSDRLAIRRQGEMIYQASQNKLRQECDLMQVQEKLGVLLKKLDSLE